MHVTDGAQAFGLDTYMQAKVENLLWHPHSRHGTGSVLYAPGQSINRGKTNGFFQS